MPWMASSGPTRKVLLALALLVLLVHAVFLLGVGSPLSVQLGRGPQGTPLQMRVVPAPAPLPVTTAATGVARKPRATAPPPAENAQALVRAAVEDAAPVQEPALEASAPLPQRAADTPAQTAMEAPAPMPPPVSTVQKPAEGASAWPLIPLGALPPPRQIQYQLTGMDKGLTYHASGELRWQHNDTEYELTLAVRAFLIGRRQWRSVGRIEATGLAPIRFSDSWRNERAAHFDRAQKRIVFSSNSTPAVLEPGAQDQVSLYVQLAAAMAGDSERFMPGARLQIQTATVRDAQPWSLVLEGMETMALDGQSLKVLKWSCQPRNRFDARVEFWVAAEQAWLPLRIRITQASGSFIDLAFRSADPLPPLPVQGDATGERTPS